MKKTLALFLMLGILLACENYVIEEPLQETSLSDSSYEGYPLHEGMETIQLASGDTAYIVDEDTYVIQGDILLTREQVDLIQQGALTRGAVLSGVTKNWTNGNIYYSFASGLPTTVKNAFMDGVRHWEANANVKFTLRSNQSNYIEVVTGNGNSSYVGMIGGKQQLSLTSLNVGTAVHEIGHAVGMIHEHSRPDRDNYITVDYSNIKPAYKYAFDKSTLSLDMTRELDFNSVMIYPSLVTDPGFVYDISKPVMRKKSDNSTWYRGSSLSEADLGIIAQKYGMGISVTINGSGYANTEHTVTLNYKTKDHPLYVYWTGSNCTITENNNSVVVKVKPLNTNAKLTARILTKYNTFEQTFNIPLNDPTAPNLSPKDFRTAQGSTQGFSVINQAGGEIEWMFPFGVEVVQNSGNYIRIKFPNVGTYTISCCFKFANGFRSNYSSTRVTVYEYSGGGGTFPPEIILP